MKEELLLMIGLLIVAAVPEVAADALDSLGDPLPKGAVQRLGTLRMRYGGVSDLAYLPDGRGVILTGTYVDIWDLAKGEMQSRTQVAAAGLASARLRTDGKALLLGAGDGTVYEWDFEKLAVVRQWETGQGGLRSACYSPDGKRLLTAGASPPGLMEFDLESGQKTADIKTGFATTRCGAIYGPDGKTAIMGGGYNHLLEHRDLATGELLRKWGTNYEAKDIELSPDGTCLLMGVESCAEEYKLSDYSLLHRYDPVPGEAGRCYALDYAPARNEAVLGLRTGAIYRFDRETGKEVMSWMAHDGPIMSICVSPDCQWVLSWGGGLVQEANMDTGQPHVRWERHSGSVGAVAFAPSGDRLISGSADATLRVWDPTTGKCELIIEGAKLGAYALDVSPDRQRVAAGCKDSVVREYSLADGKLLRELDGHRGYVRSVAYTHDGSRLLSSADDGSVCVWTTDATEPAMRLEGHRGGVLSVAVAPDDSIVLSGGRDGTVRIWDLADGKLLETFKEHRGWVEAVAFAGKGRYGLSTGRDGRILRWNLDSRELAGEIVNGGWVYSMSASPDGTKVYCSSGNGVNCWDLAEGKRIAELGGHLQAVRDVAVSPDGKTIATGSQDTTVLLWGAPESAD